MESDDQEIKNNIKENFIKALNKHGYSFQNAVLKKINYLNNRTKSKYSFVASEFPVSVGKFNTRIDFIVKRDSITNTDNKKTFLVCECKRCNPAYSKWVFAKTRYIFRDYCVNKNGNDIYADSICEDDTQEPYITNERFDYNKDIYHYGFPIKTEKKGDSKPKNNTEIIEEASTQVCKGLNGLIEELYINSHDLIKKKKIMLIPVIFTTAELWVSDIEIEDSNLYTGNFENEDINLNKVSYLWYMYNISPGIKHKYGFYSSIEELEHILEKHYIRFIAIVNSAGIEKFLEDVSKI